MGNTTTTEELKNSVADVKPGKLLRVRTADFILEASFQRLDGAYLRLEGRAVAIDSVLEVWASGSAASTGMIIGATITALVASVYAAKNYHPGYLLFTVPIGSIVGGVVGLGVGQAIPKWHRIYPVRARGTSPWAK